MIYEMTVQLRVPDIKKGQEWYETLLHRPPDFIPHEGFAEWELVPGCWLQVAEGSPSVHSGPIRLGVEDICKERERLTSLLGTEHFEIHAREEVPVKWGTFRDPWGNGIGLFQYHDKSEMMRRIDMLRNEV
ncbi:VOC family protein (plasmid) [Cytobacillus spongiae]|uniref:VOC family protein n=1 Tax=Cytobacillus spongiae TaxID=2901381 RepID=UPI00145E9BF1|nr:VOC family protein [Cytobacillus spongiae]MCA1062695.1 VOC family protein [Rossellomorea aquimaris]NMH70034.1 VOC family protein [Bacillus sp. RO3]UII58322.1 VOC family protein [Cytobacillus spongiae]WJV28638.1 VOC family protein [Rossellomorea sp. AcN35-11]